MSNIKYHISCFDIVSKQAFQFSKLCILRIASCVNIIPTSVFSVGVFDVFHIELANDIPIS